MKTVAVIVAAGKSERMARNKLKQMINGKRLIDRVLDALEQTSVNAIVVVIGSRAEEMKRILKPRSPLTQIVVNENYEEGMTSSFKKGLEHSRDADAAFLVLGDQLILEPQFIDVAIGKMQQSKSLIVSPTHNGKKGHPVLFSRELFEEILNLGDQETVRDVVHRHGSDMMMIGVGDWALIDIDTPEDLARIEQKLGAQRTRNQGCSPEKRIV